jgi:hypothetical protein
MASREIVTKVHSVFTRWRRANRLHTLLTLAATGASSRVLFLKSHYYVVKISKITLYG